MEQLANRMGERLGGGTLEVRRPGGVVQVLSSSEVLSVCNLLTLIDVSLLMITPV